MRGEFIRWFHFPPPLDSSEDIEVGYRLKRAFWGKTYAMEGAIALIHKGFTELGTKRVFAKALAVNSGSIHVMEKAGLKFDKSFIEIKFPGSNKEAVRYAFDKNEFNL